MSEKITDLNKNKRKFKCPISKCRFKGDTYESLLKHFTKEHYEDRIDEGFEHFSPKRYLFAKKNNKYEGFCVICKRNSDWSEDKIRYERYCSEECRKEAGKRAKKNHLKVYNTESFFGDPNFHEKILKNRKISGQYRFNDGKKIDYTGTYEKDFLEYCEENLKLKSSDFYLGSMSEYGILFFYEMKKEHYHPDVFKKYGEEFMKQHLGKKFYMPDFYLPEYNLIIEIKSGDNTHHKILNIDRVKERQKYQSIYYDTNYHFIRIQDKNYTMFTSLLDILKTESYSVDNANKLYKLIIAEKFDFTNFKKIY